MHQIGGWRLAGAAVLLLSLATSVQAAAKRPRAAGAAGAARRSAAATPAATSVAEQAYLNARVAYYELLRDPRKQQFRTHWMAAIGGFDRIVEQFPATPEAPKALYSKGKLLEALYRVSYASRDLTAAIRTFERLESDYRKSPLADDGLWMAAELLCELRNDKAAAARRLALLIARHPDGDMASRARTRLLALGSTAADSHQPNAPSAAAANANANANARDNHAVAPAAAAHAAMLVDLRIGQHHDRSRIVLELSQAVQAKVALVTSDAGERRLQIDLAGVARDTGESQQRHVGGPLINSVAVAKHGDHDLRVHAVLKRSVAISTMTLANPARIVVDLKPSDSASASATDSNADSNTDSNTDTNAATNAGAGGAQDGSRHRVVIDPGHGGHDTGAIGYRGVREKNVVLPIAREVARYLDAAGIDAVLTRDKDKFIELRERTAMANKVRADLFVSIHANSAKNRQAQGVETYYLDLANDRYALRLAAVENQMSEDDVSDLQLILADLLAKANTPESAGLARRVQASVVDGIRPLHPDVRDLGVKSSLFYVLVGARMPSVLIETSFLSHRREAKLLTEPRYQRRLARAIADAIAAHLGTPMRVVRP